METGINLTMIIVLIILIMGAVKGWKMGLIQEIVSLISFILLVIVLLLIASGIQSFINKKYTQILFVIILLLIVSLASKIGSLIFKLGKSVAKLPLLSIFNKLAGMIFGIAEGLVFVWVAMVAMIMFENNSICQFLIREVSENVFLH